MSLVHQPNTVPTRAWSVLQDRLVLWFADQKKSRIALNVLPATGRFVPHRAHPSATARANLFNPRRFRSPERSETS